MDISNKIRERGIKVTPQRRVVYNVMKELCHASVEEIVKMVYEKNQDITVSTIYNILDCFADKKIISRLSTPMGKLYYDINPATHQHIITQSGEIADYNDPKLTAMLTEYLQDNPPAGLDVESINVQFVCTKNNNI